MNALSLLALANSILSGAPVAKAEGQVEDPDAINGADARAKEGVATEETVESARKEAQAAQQAAAPAPGEDGAPGAPSAGDGDGDEGGAGEGDGDGDEEVPVAKAEIIESMKFLAQMHNITGEEVAKAFSGLEGDPSEGKAPVGAGVEILQRIVEGQENQNKILDAIAGFLAEMSKNHVSLSGEVAKSLVAAESAKSEAAKVSDALAGIMKTAPASPTKALPGTEILKSQDTTPIPTANDLFQAALKGELSPLQAAAHNRIAHHGRS